MEIFLVIVVLAVIAVAAFLWYRSQNQGGAGLSRGDSGPALRGQRGAARAARHDPMAEAVERHAMATDPHEAAEAELRLQAQANRVAADLHAQQASSLESHAGGRGFGGRGAAPTDAYGQPAAYDAAGAPAYQGAAPDYQDDQGVYETTDGKTIDAMGRPVQVDRPPVYGDGQPAAYDDGRPVHEDDGAAYYDEQGRPVRPEDRPRY